MASPKAANASGVASSDHDLRKRNVASTGGNGHVPERKEVDNKKLQKVRAHAMITRLSALIGMCSRKALSGQHSMNTNSSLHPSSSRRSLSSHVCIGLDGPILLLGMRPSMFPVSILAASC
jgi:hypothetical protein